MKSLTSGFIRWGLVTLVVMTAAAGGVYAYKALTGGGTAEVKESLSWVSPNTFTVSLYPQESRVETMTIANASPIDSSPAIVWKVKPDGSKKGFIVTIPDTITIPANGQASFDVTMAATASAEPGSYEITFDIER